MFGLSEIPLPQPQQPESESKVRQLTPTLKSLEWHDPEPVLQDKTMDPIPATVVNWNPGSRPYGFLKLSRVPTTSESGVRDLSPNTNVYIDGLSLVNESGRGDHHTPKPGEIVYVYAFEEGNRGPRVSRALTATAHEQMQAKEAAKRAAQTETEAFVKNSAALQEAQQLLQERLPTTPLLQETQIPNLRREEPILHCKLRAFQVTHDPQTNSFTAAVQADFTWVTYRPETQVDRSADLVIENILPAEHSFTTRFMSADRTQQLADRFNEQGEFKVVYPVLGQNFELWHAIKNPEFKTEPASRDQQLQHLVLQFTVETPLGPQLVKILLHEPAILMYDAFTLSSELLPANLRDLMMTHIDRTTQANQEVLAQQVLTKLEKLPLLEQPTPENTVVTLTKKDYLPSGANVTPEQKVWLAGMGTQLEVQLPARQRSDRAALTIYIGGVLPDLSQATLEGQRGYQKWSYLLQQALGSFRPLQMELQLLDENHRARLLTDHPELQFITSEEAFAEYCRQFEQIVKNKLQVVYPVPLKSHDTLRDAPPAGITQEVLIAVTNLNNDLLSLTSAQVNETLSTSSVYPASLGYVYEYHGQTYRLPPLVMTLEGKQVTVSERGQAINLTWENLNQPLTTNCQLYAANGQPLSDAAGQAIKFPVVVTRHVSTWEGDRDDEKSSVTLTLKIEAMPELPLRVAVTPPPEETRIDLPYAERIRQILNQADLEPRLKSLLSIDSLATAQDRIDALIHDQTQPLELVSLLHVAKQLASTIDINQPQDWGLNVNYNSPQVLLRSFDSGLSFLREGKLSEARLALNEVKTVLKAIQTKLRSDALRQSGNRVNVELQLSNQPFGFTTVTEYLSAEGQEITNFTADRKTGKRTYPLITAGSVLAKIDTRRGTDFAQILTFEVPDQATLTAAQLATVEQQVLKSLGQEKILFELQLAELDMPLSVWQAALQKLANAPAGTHTLELKTENQQPVLSVTLAHSSPEIIPLETLPKVTQPHTKDELLNLANALLQAAKTTRNYQEIANRVLQLRAPLTSFTITSEKLMQVERLLLAQAKAQDYEVIANSFASQDAVSSSQSPLKMATPLGLERDKASDEDEASPTTPFSEILRQAMVPNEPEKKKPTNKTKADILVEQLARSSEDLLSIIMRGKLQHDSRPWTLAIAAVLTKDYDSIFKLLKYNFIVVPNGVRSLSKSPKFTIKEVQDSLTDIIKRPQAMADLPQDEIIQQATHALKRLTVYQYLTEAFFDPTIRDWIGAEDPENEQHWMQDVFDQLVKLSNSDELPAYTENSQVLQQIVSQTVENKM